MKKRIVFIVIFLLLLISGGVAFYILSQPPKETLSKEFKEEAVTKLLGRKAQLDAKNIPTGDTEYKGKNISFKYPAKAVIYTYRGKAAVTNKSLLEDFSFDISDPKLVFNMQVTKNTSDFATIQELPSLKLRENRSYEYTKTPMTISGQEGFAYFKKENGAEKSGFFLYNDKIYMISITGSSAEEVEKLFDSVVASTSFL